METVNKPVFTLLYSNKNITTAMEPYVTSVRYTDHKSNISDEIEIEIADRDFLFQSSWYPDKGANLNLQIGYDGSALQPCGDFEIDELEYLCPPDTMRIKALAAGIKQSTRQENSIAYENTTLQGIAQQVANRNGYTLIGDIDNIPITRATQDKETDLAFLKRVANSYGYIFKITGSKLVFFKIDALDDNAAVLSLDRSELISVNLRDKTFETYTACTVSYHDPKTKKLIESSQPGEAATANVLKIHERCENQGQAQVKSKAALQRKNTNALIGTIILFGNPSICAGINITLTGFYHLNGTYSIESAEHIISRNRGYITSMEVRKID